MEGFKLQDWQGLVQIVGLPGTHQMKTEAHVAQCMSDGKRGSVRRVKRDVRSSMDARCGNERTENVDLDHVEADGGLENEGCQSQQAKEELLMCVDPSKSD
jgi:hypothetical protein